MSVSHMALIFAHSVTIQTTTCK